VGLSEKKGLLRSAIIGPKLDYLAVYEAQEREGVEILKRDGRKFFILKSDLPAASNAGGLGANSDDMEEDEDRESSSATTAAATGASLGVA
jgi:hypothetical protein